MRNIILCGFMGSGKTTLAKRLSEKLNMPFLDTDEEISKQEGKSITEIFAENGEAYFRTLETELIKRLSKEEGKIISLGGGLAAKTENHTYLKKAGTVIFIDCPVDKILYRILGDSSRPLTKTGKEEIINLYNLRRPLYQKVADITIDSSSSKSNTLRLALEALDNIKK